MGDTKKIDEASTSEELAERVELTDEELDQASGGGKSVILLGMDGKKFELAIDCRTCSE